MTVGILLVGLFAFVLGLLDIGPRVARRPSPIDVPLTFAAVTLVVLVLGDDLAAALVHAAAWTFTVIAAAPLGAAVRARRVRGDGLT